jgi:hypothetical protein
MDRRTLPTSPEVVGFQPGIVYFFKEIQSPPFQHTARVVPGARLRVDIPIDPKLASVWKQPQLKKDVATESRHGQMSFDVIELTYNGNGHLEAEYQHLGEGTIVIPAGARLDVGLPYAYTSPLERLALQRFRGDTALMSRMDSRDLPIIPGGTYEGIEFETVALPAIEYHPRIVEPGEIDPTRAAKGPDRLNLHRKIGYNGGVPIQEADLHPSLDEVAWISSTPILALPDRTALMIVAGLNRKTNGLVRHTRANGLKSERYNDATGKYGAKYVHPIMLETQGEITDVLCYAFQTQRVA